MPSPSVSALATALTVLPTVQSHPRHGHILLVKECKWSKCTCEMYSAEVSVFIGSTCARMHRRKYVARRCVNKYPCKQ